MLGSYIKAGDAIRINLKLQDASTGQIISTERVDAPNEASLFPMMDDLTRRVKTRFVSSGGGAARRDCCQHPARSRAASARSRPEGRHHIVDGGLSLLRGRHRASPARALSSRRCRSSSARSRSIPVFALAYVEDGGGERQHRPLQRARPLCQARARACRSPDAARALLHRGLLLLGQCLQVARAIAAYQKAVDLYPDHSASRNNLA